MTVQPEMPALPDPCWPVDTTVCSDFEALPQEVQDYAVSLAGQTMRMLTGYQIGGCPVLLRPCSTSCVAASEHWYGFAGTFTPHINSLGQWVNTCGCSPSGCSCSNLSTITVSGGIGRVIEVKVDGDVLPETAYAVHNGNRLVRLDGGSWPTCQAMDLDDDQPGTFSVRLERGAPVDGLGAIAAGLLACEYAKAFRGQKCSLPKNVVSITRQGVSMELQTGVFINGLTGIREVDVYISRFNPHGLRRGSAIWSPDLRTPVERTSL